MPLLAVDPQHYVSASAILGGDVVRAVDDVIRSLTSEIAATQSGGGSDPPGLDWAESYDITSADLTDAMRYFRNACLRLASMLQRTGLNHSFAEVDSDSGRPGGVPDTVDYESEIVPILLACGPNSMRGGSGDLPDGWSLVADQMHHQWPDGKTDLLRRASHAWAAAERALDSLLPTIRDAVALIQQQTAPEALDAATVCGAMEIHLTRLTTLCGDLGAACSTYAGCVDEVHRDCTPSLSQLVELVDGDAIGAVLLNDFTYGHSGEVAVDQQHQEIDTTARELNRYLSSYAQDIARQVSIIDGIDDGLGDVTLPLQEILGLESVSAVTTPVAGGPLASSLHAEQVSLDRWQVASAIGWGGVQFSDRLGGHIETRHVGKSRDYLIWRANDEGKPRTSTFKDLATADALTSANIAAHTADIRAWLNGKKSTEIFVSPAPPDSGIVYLKSTGRFAKPTRVVTRLNRDGNRAWVVTSFLDT